MLDHDKFETRFRKLAAKHGYHGKYYILAKKLGYSESSLYKWLNGLSYPSMQLMDKICDMWNVSLDWLTGRTDVNINEVHNDNED